MQPLAYFAVRCLLGWLQCLERHRRGFCSSPLLLVATGAAHCWAVVYALFIAIHTRAMRVDGYHEGYIEHLPWWVSSTETLSIAAMGIWWAAGFVTAAIRIISDDGEGLPTEKRDVATDFIGKVASSQLLQWVLAGAHTVSCVGLFGSIVLLCATLGLMAGTITGCEICLALVSLGFTVPHAVVAVKRLFVRDNKKEDDPVYVVSAMFEGSSQEAAALGPMLCVVLALADSPGHAFLWQNFTYAATAIAYLAAVALSGMSPRKIGTTVLAPELGELITCFLLDVFCSVCLVVCFPHLNCWQIWAMFGLLLLILVAITFPMWRELFVELLEPLMVVRGDNDKVLPNTQRDSVRRLSWVLALVCSGIAFWDIMAHPVEVEEVLEPPDEHLHHELPMIWDRDSHLMLRWKPESPITDERELLDVACDSMNLPYDGLALQSYIPEHRLLIFRITRRDYKGRTEAHEHWLNVWSAPEGKMAQIADVEFPHNLNMSLCLHHENDNNGFPSMPEADILIEQLQEKINEIPELSGDFSEVIPEEPEAKAAYLAACDWWHEELNQFYAKGEHKWNPLGNDDLEAELEKMEENLRKFQTEFGKRTGEIVDEESGGESGGGFNTHSGE